MTEKAPLNIYQRINEVRKAVKNVAKDIEVKDGGRYQAVSHDAVTAATRDVLAEQGVLPVPTLLNSTFNETGRTSSSGTPMMRYTGTYRVKFVNIDNPTETVEVTVESHALDFGDKAPGKALSYAVKYAILKLLGIVSGENEEERPEAFSKPKTLDDDQMLKIQKVAEECYGDGAEEKLASMMKKVTFGPANERFTKLADVPAFEFNRIVALLRNNAPKKEASSDVSET